MGKSSKYKNFSVEKPYFWESTFTKNADNYNLRNQKLLFQSKMNSKRFGSYYFGFHASHLSNQLQDHIKNGTSVKAINNKLVENWQEVTLSFSEWNQADKINQKIALKKDGAIQFEPTKR